MLLQTHYNLNLAFPGQVLLLNKFDRSGDNLCLSRIGTVVEALSVNNGESITEIVRSFEDKNDTKLKYLLVDEAQFFLPRQVAEMAFIADYMNVDVIAYGLLTNYKGRMFKGSARFMELCDKSIHLTNEMRCWCGSPATHNSIIKTDKEEKDVEYQRSWIEYEVVCRKHFYEIAKLRHLDFSDDDIAVV